MLTRARGSAAVDLPSGRPNGRWLALVGLPNEREAAAAAAALAVTTATTAATDTTAKTTTKTTTSRMDACPVGGDTRSAESRLLPISHAKTRSPAGHLVLELVIAQRDIERLGRVGRRQMPLMDDKREAPVLRRSRSQLGSRVSRWQSDERPMFSLSLITQTNVSPRMPFLSTWRPSSERPRS